MIRGREKALQEKVRICEQAHAPYAALAEQIKNEVDALTTGTDSMHGAVENILRSLSDQERANKVHGMLDALSPKERRDILQHLFGDAAISATLETERQIACRQAELDAAIELLQFEGRTSRTLDTYNIPQGSQVTFEQHRYDDLIQAGSLEAFGDKTKLGPDRLIIAQAMGDGVFKLLSEKQHKLATHVTPQLQLGELFEFGTPTFRGATMIGVEPKLYYAGPTWCRVSDQWQEIRVAIGPHTSVVTRNVTVGNTNLFDLA